MRSVDKLEKELRDTKNFYAARVYGQHGKPLKNSQIPKAAKRKALAATIEMRKDLLEQARLDDTTFLIATWRDPQNIEKLTERLKSGWYSVRDLLLYKALIERNERFIEFYAKRFYPETIQVEGEWKPLVLGGVSMSATVTGTFPSRVVSLDTQSVRIEENANVSEIVEVIDTQASQKIHSATPEIAQHSEIIE